jgi:hypothetical protein
VRTIEVGVGGWGELLKGRAKVVLKGCAGLGKRVGVAKLRAGEKKERQFQQEDVQGEVLRVWAGKTEDVCKI